MGEMATKAQDTNTSFRQNEREDIASDNLTVNRNTETIGLVAQETVTGHPEKTSNNEGAPASLEEETAEVLRQEILHNYTPDE